MTERMLVEGNVAMCRGAVDAGCRHFFGYPITPQNEVPEWFSRELPKIGGVYVQAQSETGSINMLYGAASAGARVMTSTAGPGWSLMQETISHINTAETPCVIGLVQRTGPGAGGPRHSQNDYNSAVKGGGHGGYKNIVLAPASVQETYELAQLAFYLADKYRNIVVILTDAVLGLLLEPLEPKVLDFGPLPPKDWAIGKCAPYKDKKIHMVEHAGFLFGDPTKSPYLTLLKHLSNKWAAMEADVRYEEYKMQDADLVLVAFGYVSRSCKEAINQARKEGLKVGLLRPITLFPFPTKAISELATQGKKFMVVEDNIGQMVDDVRLAVEGRAKIYLVNAFARDLPTEMGSIMPDKILEEVKKVL
jgi:2-oxoglutarate/2-oxoacid ferredoxin oxidoreductase subunit alpha